MAKKIKILNYSQMVKKILSKSKWESNPEAAKVLKKKKLELQAKKMSNKMTTPERIFSNMMKELGVKFESQKVLGNKIFDFYIPSKNMLVEVHGDYWHSNPLIYEEKDLNKIQIRNQKNDKYKETLAKGNNYSFCVVWEHDLNNDYKEQKKRFKKILKDE